MLGDHQTLTAVLTLGSEHTTKESPRIWETKPDQGDKALDWQHVYVFTGRTPDELPPRESRRYPGMRGPQQEDLSNSGTTSALTSSTTAQP